MNARRLKFTAIAGLALAMALVAFALLSGLQAASTTGPEALVATPRGEVWIGVGQQVWRTSGDGHLLARTALADIGLPGRPANLLRHPDGHLVATVRDDPRLFVIDADTARVVRTITPAWPQDLQRKGQEAINLAFAPDGRFAVATGGGHAVVLFGADGALLARTEPGTYQFTNGLWWVGDDVWTTDTNRYVLRRLDGRTLSVVQNIPLSAEAAARFLGQARAASAPGEPPVALVRFRNGMIQGRVVVIRPGGEEVPLPHDGAFEPGDVEWLGDQVLATDGASLAVRRWSAEGRALAPFGDASLNEPLQQIATTRAGLERRHGQGLGAGIAVFLAALALAVASQRMDRREAPHGAPLDLSHVGTPILDRAAFARRAGRLLWPVALVAALCIVLQGPWLRHGIVQAMPGSPPARIALVLAFVVATLVVGIAMARAVLHKARLPEYEPVFNAAALNRLKAATGAQLPMAEGEHVVETFVWVRDDTGPSWRSRQRAQQAARWVVCTNHAIRLFEGAATAPVLDIEFALTDIASVAAHSAAPARSPWTPAGLAQRARRHDWLEIVLTDGRKIAGTVTSIATRDRLLRWLEGAPVAASTSPHPPAAPAPGGAGPRPLQAALASAVVPGLGQWWQGRFATGVLLFVTWAGLVLALTIPVAWAALGVHSEVSARTLATTLATQLGYTLFAAWEAWQAECRAARV